MSADDTNHTNGTCDNCGRIGPLGWVVGQKDLSHKHSCKSPECRDALKPKELDQ